MDLTFCSAQMRLWVGALEGRGSLKSRSSSCQCCKRNEGRWRYFLGKKKEEAHYGCQGVWGMLQIEGTCSLRELCTQRQEGSAELMAVTWPSPPICC